MSKKADKRLSKKIGKEIKQKNRQIREVEAIQVEKVARSEIVAVDREKVPKISSRPADIQMTWDVKYKDHDGNWSWGRSRFCSRDEWRSVVVFLNGYQSKKWGEIDAERTGIEGRRRAKHCYYTHDQLIDEAVERLKERNLETLSDTIFRFRLSGPERIFGLRLEGIFHYVWFDCEHKIYKAAD